MARFPFPKPVVLDAEVFVSLPQRFRRPGVSSYWADRNRRGMAVDSFLEGPCFDHAGNLWFMDTPFGRIFKADAQGNVEQMAEYDGQPKGLALHPDGRIFIADFKNGIMVLDPGTGDVSAALCGRGCFAPAAQLKWLGGNPGMTSCWSSGIRLGGQD